MKKGREVRPLSYCNPKKPNENVGNLNAFSITVK